MIILAIAFEGQYYHGEHLRWNLGWATPNYAGAFLATLLALSFVVTGSRWRWAMLVTEVGGLFLLAKTCSRGAVIAWAVAWLFGIAATRAWRDPVQRRFWAARVGTLAVMLLATGFGWGRAVERETEITRYGAAASDGPASGQSGKIKPINGAPTTEDGSVMNRLALWRGGLEMMAAAPLRGWGAGGSGRAYMNWFQDVNRTDGYATMVNSYLHVGVEHGLTMLAGVIFGLAGFLLVAWSAGRDGLGDEKESPASRLLHGSLRITRPTCVAAGASLVAWAVANVFTTLWIEPKLWIVPGISCGVIVLGGSCNRSSVRWRWILGLSTVSALLFAGGLLAAGKFLRAGPAWRAELGEGRTVVVRSGESSRHKAAPATKGEAWQVWPDMGVLGPTPGKELRRWVETLPTTTYVVVHPATPIMPVDAGQIAENVALLGRQAERLGRNSLPECRQLVLIHPRGTPPAKWAGEKERPQITVLIPAIDETGEVARWQRWAVERGARVVVSPGVGQDIRAAWPGVIGFLGTEGKGAR